MGKKQVGTLQGCLLLDGGMLGGSWFSRTVVLICRHDEAGAFGLVLNRKGDSEPGIRPPGPFPDSLAAEPVYAGGPVQPTLISYLYFDPAMLLPNVIDQVRVSQDLEDVLGVAGGLVSAGRVRIFAGYAGWSAGQLEGELRREAWIVHPASVDLIFDPAPEGLWRKILKSRPNWQDHLLADSPEELDRN